MKVMFRLRPYEANDYSDVAEVYHDAVETLTGSAYNDEQVQMWAGYPASGDERTNLRRAEVRCLESGAEAPQSKD